MRPETLAIRTQTERTGEKEHSTPLFLTSSFVYDSAEDMAAAFSDESLDVNIYSRFSNPSVDEFIKKVCLMEGAEDGIATATGMAAVNACFMTFLSAGDHVISASAVFGSTHAILTKYLPKWGIEYSYFDMNKPETIEALVKSNTKLLYVETPSNPGLDIIDMELVAAICKKHNIIFVVDNCFATPAVQQPIQFGADLVLHSATKFMDGQGRVLGGVVVGKKELVREMYLYIRNTGFLAGNVFRHKCSFLFRFVGEHSAFHYISYCINARNICLQMIIYRHSSALINGNACFIETKIVRVGRAAHSY